MAEVLTFNFFTQIIEVPAPDISLDLQYLLDSIRDAEDDINPGMAFKKICDAFGKQDLGGGVTVGITVVLLDGWRVKFEDRPGSETIAMTITGGNFVGEAGANPVAPSTFTSVTTQQSSSATIITPESDTNLVYLVESLRNSHPAFGSVFYWDPYGGNDSNDGLSPTSATLTFSAAHTLASPGTNDVIFCRPTDPAGTMSIDETLAITKTNLKVRGPGNPAQLIPSSTSAATIDIGADNVEVSGFYVETAGSGTENAITVAGDNILLRDMWITNTMGHGVSISSSARFRMLTSVVENAGGSGTGDGFNLSTNTTQSLLSKCIINDNQNGIVLSGTGITDNVIENCLIYKNSAYGIDVGTGVNRTTIRGANTITNNTTANTLDNGTDTFIESPSGGASTTDIADAVWNEVIADHTTAGSTGRTLKDAKTKATLASLK